MVRKNQLFVHIRHGRPFLALPAPCSSATVWARLHGHTSEQTQRRIVSTSSYVINISAKMNQESKDAELDQAMRDIENFKKNQQSEQDYYSKLKSDREKATFSMMMKMNPDALTNIRKEFFARRDSVTLDEFIYIIQKHLVNRKGDDSFVMETPEQREFGTNMYELFKDIDVNGDGQLEWQEFTSFTVEKANLLNKRQKLTSIAHYHDSTHTLDPSAHYRHRHDISRFVQIPQLCQFAIVEDHKNSIFVFNSRLGKHTATISTESAPIAIESIAEKDRVSLVTSGADMTLSTFSLDDPNPKRRYKVQTSWATPGVQMALAYAPDSRLLYSGATNGNIYSWNVQERNLVTTLPGHTDIVMNLIILQKLNNVASASLDKTVSVWDSHTNERILTLHGHKKGVFDLTYNPQHRLIFSCGFEHDACVWSPFVNSLVYRLKGHHASLVGCQSVEGSHEVITADTSGVFKLWDVRNFQCVQTFSANLSGQETKDSSKLTCFFHSKLPSRNSLQEEDDSRIYAASKMLFSFDQARVVHEATTDYFNVCWMAWIKESSVIITASEHNVIVWDALIGSKTFTHPQICDEEISACCLDDRRRKIIIGDIKGKIGVYNCSNGALMKTVHKAYGSTCVSLHYFDDAKRFIAGFARGQVCIFDENVLEECILIRQFECYGEIRAEVEFKDPRKEKSAPTTKKVDDNKLPKEMLSIEFDHQTHTVATAGATDGMLRLWDYDSSKCNAEIPVCNVKTSQIVNLKMLLPYPLLVTSDSSGNIILWGSRGVKWVGMRLAAFVNMTPASAQTEPKPRNSDETDTAPRRALPPRSKTPLSVKRAEEEAQWTMDSDGDDVVMFSDVKPNKFARMDSQKDYSADYEMSLLLAEKLYLDSEAKWGRCSAAHAISWNASKLLLITGDDLGNVRCFSMRDAMADLQKETLLNSTEHDNHTILGLCKDIIRDDSAALPPIDHDISSYLLARPHDAMSYMGVRFQWAIYAHHDRIINCTCTPDGVLTSGADRLVKMWSFEGLPIGTLLQSVPIGFRSRTWDLVLDIKSIIKKENEELDEIIEQVSELARGSDKPDIYSMDFTGMQLGAESANFSQSVLRQRIELTTKILGIDFPTSGQAKAQSADDLYSVDMSSVAGSVSSAGGKSLADALSEIKSTESGVDYEFKTKSMSYIQQRRKANKLENISRQYEEKSGVKLNTTNKEISIWEEEGDGKNKEVDFDKLLSTANTVASRDDASINDDLYSVDAINQKRQKGKEKHAASKNFVESKIADSIKQAHDRGPRTISMLKSCQKYRGFHALDEAIQTNGASKVSINLSSEEAAEIRAVRERKIRGASVIGSSFLMSAKDRKNSALVAAGLKVAASASSVSSTSPKAAVRNRHNSADTEGTDDSLKHQLVLMHVHDSSLGNGVESPKSTVMALGKADSPAEHGSVRESPEGSPHMVSARTGAFTPIEP